MVGDQRQGWAIFAVMGILFLAGAIVCLLGRKRRATRPSPRSASTRRRAPCRPAATWKARRSASASPTRRSSPRSPPMPPAARSTPCTTASRRWAAWSRWSTSSSARSSSAASAPGLYGMLLFAIIAVFVAGLMVGRTPEYLGKKIEAKEVKMAILAILILPLSILGFTAIAAVRAGGPGRARQCRPARLQRDPLRLHLGDRQQRQRLRRAQRQHALLQHDARRRDVHRPLPLHHADAGGRRLAGAEEDRAALGRHLPDPWPASSSAC